MKLVDQRPTSGELAALRSAGMTVMIPLRAVTVVLLPRVVDSMGMTASPTRRHSRVERLVRTRRRLIDQLWRRAEHLGATGVVGMTFAERTLDVAVAQATGDVVELTLTALPVLSASRPIPTASFRTAMGPADTASLIGSGWVPVDVLVAGTTQNRSRRHRDADALAATSRTNREIPGPTDMIQRAKRQLRERFATGARSLGADGVLLHGGFDVAWSSTYHQVQVGATANVIARWDTRGINVGRTLPLDGAPGLFRPNTMLR